MAESEVRNWVASVTKDSSAASGDIVTALKSGVVLCKLVNELKPGTILKINDYNSAFRQAENLQAFAQAAKIVFGVADADIFAPEDIQQGRNIPKTLLTLVAVAQANGALQSVNLDQLRSEAQEQDAKNAANPALKKNNPGTHLSLFEQGQARAQTEASKANTAARSKQIVQTESGVGSQSTLSFAEAQQQAAQKRSGEAHLSKNANVRSSGKHLGGFSMAEAKQMEAQKMASSALNQKHSNARVGDAGVGSNVLSMTEAKQMEAQKLATSGPRAGVVARSEGTPSNVLSMTEAQQLQTQKLASSAMTQKHNVARAGSEAAPSNVLSMTDVKHLEDQKLARETHLASNSLVRGPAGPSGPVVVAPQQ